MLFKTYLTTSMKSKNKVTKNKNIKSKKKYIELIRNKFKKLIDLIKKKIKKHKDKKKIIIICIIIVVLIVLAIIIINASKNAKQIPVDEIFNVVDYRKVRTKRSRKKISPTYNLKRYKVFETKNEIQLNNLTGKILFVRSKKFNANVFQTRTKLSNKDNQEPILMQVYKQNYYFKDGSLETMKLSLSAIPINEKLTGKSKHEYDVPLEESIYFEKRQYNSTYIGPDGNKYDINYYMDGDYLVCELVKFLN